MSQFKPVGLVLNNHEIYFKPVVKANIMIAGDNIHLNMIWMVKYIMKPGYIHLPFLTKDILAINQ